MSCFCCRDPNKLEEEQNTFIISKSQKDDNNDNQNYDNNDTNSKENNINKLSRPENPENIGKIKKYNLFIVQNVNQKKYYYREQLLTILEILKKIICLYSKNTKNKRTSIMK